MKKRLIALLAGALVCVSAAAEPQQMVTAQRTVELPEGYYLLNSNTIEGSAGGERLTVAQTVQGEGFADAYIDGGADVVMNESGEILMEIRNSGFVGGNHTRMPELEETLRAIFTEEMSAKGAMPGDVNLVYQYADRLYVCAFAKTADGADIARIATIDDGGCMIDIWSYADEATTGAILESLGRGVEKPAVEDMPVVRASADVNVRSGAGTSFSKLGMLKAGQNVPFTGETRMDEQGREWMCILLGEEPAWVSAQYIISVE